MTNCYLLSDGFVTVKLSLKRVLSLYRVSVKRGLSVLCELTHLWISECSDRWNFFFQVYVFDPKEPKETRGCCVRQNKLADEFPAAEGSKPLPPNLDSVYYSYKDSSVYFIRDEEVWQNVLFHPRQKHVKNSVKYLGKWYEKWFDICDVTTHSTYMFDFNTETWPWEEKCL